MKHKPFYLFLTIFLMIILVIGFQFIVKNGPWAIKSYEGLVNEPILLGTLEIKDGDMLERDIIPQLSRVFELAVRDVKEVLAMPLASYLIREELTDFRRMEGIIPPGSYEIYEGETLNAWTKKMVEAAENRYASIRAQAGQVNSLIPDEQLVLASIVEAECLANQQYAETAAVFLNRLADQNALQSCVTVEYALGFQRAFLYEEDVKVQDPYNTYFVSGLPIGPICCMDDQSLLAAVLPTKDPSLYYFYYDYLLNEMFFYADYTKFATEAVASQERFVANPPVGMHDKINKQILFGVRGQ